MTLTMKFTDAPISFPGLFGDWQFTVPSMAIDIGNGVSWYGILIAAGMLIALYFCMKQAPKYGLTEDNIIDTILWVIPFSIIGARVYYVLFYLDLFRRSDGSIDWASTCRIWDGGLAIYGGVIAGFLVALLYCRRKKLSLWAMADCCVMGLFIGQAIGRWGNFFNEEAHGMQTDLPWAQIIDGIGYHPTFLYESIWCFCLFWFLHWFDDHKRSFDGQMISLYMMLYSVERFFVEGLRTDSLMVGPLRQAQLLSLGLIAAGIALYVFFKKRTGRYLP